MSGEEEREEQKECQIYRPKSRFVWLALSRVMRKDRVSKQALVPESRSQWPWPEEGERPTPVAHRTARSSCESRRGTVKHQSREQPSSSLRHFIAVYKFCSEACRGVPASSARQIRPRSAPLLVQNHSVVSRSEAITRLTVIALVSPLTSPRSRPASPALRHRSNWHIDPTHPVTARRRRAERHLRTCTAKALFSTSATPATAVVDVGRRLKHCGDVKAAACLRNEVCAPKSRARRSQHEGAHGRASGVAGL